MGIFWSCGFLASGLPFRQLQAKLRKSQMDPNGKCKDELALVAFACGD
jgi:hypothetical protein